jgi:hypothetical protein
LKRKLKASPLIVADELYQERERQSGAKSLVISVYMARRPIANVAAKWRTNRRTGATAGGRVVGWRGRGDGIVPCCSRCRGAGAEDNCNAKANFIQHFFFPVLQLAEVAL